MGNNYQHIQNIAAAIWEIPVGHRSWIVTMHVKVRMDTATNRHQATTRTWILPWRDRGIPSQLATQTYSSHEINITIVQSLISNDWIFENSLMTLLQILLTSFIIKNEINRRKDIQLIFFLIPTTWKFKSTLLNHYGDKHYLKFKCNYKGTWLAQSVEHETLDLRLVSLSPTLSALQKKSLKKLM